VIVNAPVTVDQDASHFGTKAMNLVWAARPNFPSMTQVYLGWGEWAQNEDRGDIAHEFGHLLDLGDKHSYFSGEPDPGFENDIMGSAGKVTEDTLNRVLAGRACGCYDDDI
jgi:hypothetical protein